MIACSAKRVIPSDRYGFIGSFTNPEILPSCDAITKSIGKRGEFVMLIITDDAAARNTKTKFET